MSRADEFLDLYKQLEQAAIDEYGFAPDGRAVFELERLKQYDHIKRELKYCRDVRNLLSHNEKIDTSYSVEPSEAMLGLLRQTIYKVKNPHRCYDFSTKPPNILFARMDDPVLPYMNQMRDRGFSHLPILAGGVAVSVFSVSTVFSCLLDRGAMKIDPATRFHHLSDYLPLDRHAAESFRYLGKQTLLSDAEALFIDSMKQSRRIGMFFITENGLPHEKLLGIITPHDFLGQS